MNEEEKKQLADALAAKETAEKALADEKAASEKTIAEKDAVIAQKNSDLVGIRKEGQRLKELTEKEREDMSAKEIELHNATLALQKDQEDFQKTQKESLQKEVTARQERAITKLAGKDPELATKIRENYARIVDNDKAQTEEEVGKIVNEAFNMTGTVRTDPMKTAVNGGGDGEAGGENSTGFADSQAGKDLGGLMGLPEIKPAA